MTDRADGAADMPDALETAAAQDRAFARTGKLVGPLHGVVIAIKDQYDTKDMRTTSGADAQYANDRPPDDATFVARLRDAGAIILAKANLAEYAVDGARSSFGGTFCNPYDTEREPGMSSAGSASSVAANLVTCAIGEETVVSVRWPAAVNSLVGLAPTKELVSTDGMIGAGLNMRVGPICRTVEDTARILDVIAGYDPKDEYTALSVGRTPRTSYLASTTARSLAGLRIGVVREYLNRNAARQGRRGKRRPRRARDRCAEEARRHRRRSGAGGRAVSALHLALGAGAAEQRLHPAEPSAVSRGRVRAADRAIRSRRCIELRADPARVPEAPDAAHARRRVRRARRRQVHDQPLPARARRRQHQDERRPDRQGDVLQRSELSEPAGRARAGRACDRAGHVRAHAHPLRAADAADAVHGGTEARRAGGADVHRAAEEAAVAARAERATDATRSAGSCSVSRDSR